MAKLNRLLLFAFASNSVEPMSLAVMHQNDIELSLSVISISAVALTVYLLIKRYWGPGGLYRHALSVSTPMAYAQLSAWLTSYFLYLVFTVHIILRT
ncbi:hypothetical protein [Vulcanisaeta distributa]|uniref:hypothetical protein n=1 Tax=Vulcanisaeta distributa TaxID=164451 RepID=UPI000699BBB1|nr:hypothetical protein [Vulcanisaeta distributa]